MMNAMNMRDASRPKLSLRYGATAAPSAVRDRNRSSHMPTAELRRLIAMMID